MNPEGIRSEIPNVSTSTTSAETNTNMIAEEIIESNRTSDFNPIHVPPGVELMFDLAPGSIQIDSVEAAFVSPNTSGSNQPTTVSRQYIL